MKRKSELLTKSLSGLTAFALVFSSVPAAHIHAEDMEMVEEFDDDAVIEEDISSTYTITEFIDFQKDGDGNFVLEETKEKYGSLTATPGTSLDDLGLPEDLVMNGYYEADGPDILTTLEILDVDWVLKSDSGETYSEASPEGTYKFVPDFDTYVLESDTLDDIELAEDLKMLTISVTIASTPEETETLEESYEEDTWETDSYEEDAWETDSYEEYIWETDSYEEDIWETDSYEEDIWETDSYEEDIWETDSEEDIFSGLDDSVLSDDSDNTVITYENVDLTPVAAEAAVSTAAIDVTLVDENDNPLYSYYEANGSLLSLTTDDTVATPVINVTLSADVDLSNLYAQFVPASEQQTVIRNFTTDGTYYEDFSENKTKYYAIEIQNADTTTATYYLAITIEQAFAPTTPVTTANIDVTLSDADGNPLYSYYGETGSMLTLSTEDEAIPGINVSVGCGTDLSELYAAFTLESGLTLTRWYTDDAYNYQDFSQENTRSFYLEVQNEDLNTATFCVNITVNKAGHNWQDATCTAAKTCSVCSATTGDALGHTWKDATCTDPMICTRCAATKGEKLGHDWIAATCTDPKTCDRCGATKGNALGHELLDDWQTTKKSTDTTHGEQIRYCHRDDCDYSVTRALNIIGDPANNTISNLAEGAQYNLNTKITFSAIGAGMGNTNPINGDVRYVPTSWNIQNTPGTFLDGYTGAFSITKAGSYTVSVTFQKQIYQNGWNATDVVDSKAVTFTVGELVQGTLVQGSADAIKINPQTGDSTPIIPFVIAAVVALAVITGAVVYKKKQQ